MSKNNKVAGSYKAENIEFSPTVEVPDDEAQSAIETAADDNIVSADESTEGIVRAATAAEANNQTAVNAYVTPDKSQPPLNDDQLSLIDDALNVIKEFPRGNDIVYCIELGPYLIQAGFLGNVAASRTIEFARPFKNTQYIVTATHSRGVGTDIILVDAASRTTTSVLLAANNSNWSAFWIAIGERPD